MSGALTFTVGQAPARVIWEEWDELVGEKFVCDFCREDYEVVWWALEEEYGECWAGFRKSDIDCLLRRFEAGDKWKDGRFWIDLRWEEFFQLVTTLWDAWFWLEEADALLLRIDMLATLGIEEV